MAQLVCYPRVSKDSYVIPDGVTTIGKDAFGSNYCLKNLVIPESVTSIGESAFDDCAALETVTIEGSFVPNGVFTNCPKLSTLIISENLSEWSRIDIETLTRIQISEQNPYFASDDQGAVYDKEYATLLMCPRGFSGDFVIPEGVTAISDYAFYGCSGLTSVTIPDGMVDIGYHAFSGCIGLTEINIPEGVANIEAYAFYNCSSLSEISIPGSVNEIKYDTFASCSSLVEVTLPAGITEIGHSAFSDCDNLTTIEIPASVTSIGISVFYNCKSLTAITVAAGNTIFHSIDGVLYDNACTSVLLCPAGKTGVVVIPSSVTDIGDDAFLYCTGLSEIILPDNLKYIGDGAFTTHICHCGDSYTDSYTAALGHSFTEYVSNGNATCTEDGTKTSVCDRCDATDTVVDEGSAHGHDFTEWTMVQKPTETVEGLESRYCLNCGVEETRAVACLENPFGDVPSDSYYYEPVMWAVENGVTNGTSATTFSPTDQCKRAHVVTFLWRAMGCPEPTQTDNPFLDVKPSDFYYKPVLWALENGITSGIDATHFGPTSYCSRAQVVTFLYRTMGSPEITTSDNPFTDVPAGQWFTAPVLWAVENGITNGLSATTFGPSTICNRAQIVTFLYRAFVD